MFPIRRPCADAVRSGISVLWSSSTALYSPNGLYTSRIFIKQFQCSSRSLFTCSTYRGENQLANSSHPASLISPSPPALNTVLRGSPSVSSSAAASLKAPKNPVLEPLSTAGSGGIWEKIKFSATPKEKEREPESEPGQDRKPSGDGGNPDKPNPDQLLKTYNILQKSLERTFTHPMDYSIYNPDIVFIDNIRHIRTQGIAKYIQQISLIKVVGHIKFAYVRFDILNMSMCQEEARITVRWRIKGLSGLRVMLKFWKYKLWKWQEIMNHQETWYDGVSYFDVGADGKIFQHVADKVMEDKDRSVDDKPAGGRSLPFAAKLGGALGATAFPTPSLSYNSSQDSTSTGGGDGGNMKNNGGSSSGAASAAVVKSS